MSHKIVKQYDTWFIVGTHGGSMTPFGFNTKRLAVKWAKEHKIMVE